MFTSKRILAGAAATALVATTACVTNPETGEREFQTRTAIGAGVGAVGAYMDKQEKELRRQTAGTGVEIEREGDELLLTMPAGITFPINSYQIQPRFYATLDQVAQTLAAYPQTLVDVYGHTDPSGGDGINIPLSQNRAQSVAAYLTQRGVASARIATQGFGSSRPIADNGTEAGRAQNRRVEIRVVPATDTAR